MVQLFWGQFFDYVFIPFETSNFYHFLFTSFSCFVHFLCISYSILIHFLFNSDSFPIHFFSFPLTWESYQNSKRIGYISFINLLFKNYSFQAPNQLGKGVPHKSQKKWLIKGSKVLGLDGPSLPIHFLFYSYSFLIHVLSNSDSFPIHFLCMSFSFLIHFLFKSYSCPIQSRSSKKKQHQKKYFRAQRKLKKIKKKKKALVL